MQLLPVAAVVLLPGGLSRFVLPKLLLAAVAIGVAACARSGGALPRPVVWTVVGGGAWLAVAATAGAAPPAQLVGRWPRYEGLVALPVYAGALWAGARLLGPDAPAHRAVALLRGATAVALLGFGVGLAESFGLRPLGGDAARPGGLAGNASQEGLLGAMLVGLLLPYAVRRRDRVAAVGLLASAGLVVVSGSRGALVGALVAVGLAVWSARRDGRRVRAATAGAGAVLVLAAFAARGFRSRLVGTDELAGQSVTGRFDLWRETVRLLAARPVTGTGPSGFFDAFAAAPSQAWRLAHGTVNPPDSPHLVVLQAAVAGGAVLVLLAGLLTWWWLRGVRRARGGAGAERLLLVDGAVAAVAAGAVGLLVGFSHAATTPLMAALAGAAVATPAGRHRSVAWPVVGVASLWTLTLALACVGEVAMGRGAGLAARGDVVAAQARFDLAQTLRPWDPDVALLAAQTFAAGTNAGDQASAQAALTWTSRALGRTASSVDARRIRAVALGATGAPGQGLAVVRPLLAADPDNVDLLLAAGTLAAQSDDGRAALDLFGRATRVDPGSELAWQDLGIVATALGDQDALARVAAHTSGG